MTTRPARLPMSHTFVVWASRPDRGGLTLGEKVIWYQSWALDRGPEGCYMGAASLAERLGMEVRSVEQLRYRLRKLGLLASFARPGARQPGWVALLPGSCCPTSPQAAGKEAARLAEELDRYLLTRDPDRNAHCSASATAIAPRPAARVAALGGEGGGAPPSLQNEVPLLPAVTKKEDGVGAYAPKRKERVKDQGQEPGLVLPLLQLEDGGAADGAPEWHAIKRTLQPPHLDRRGAQA